ncbi:transglycosylase [uncultured Secundilactobacillus sp.]|uniref:aggregation-promoting factor C-terminal-like domain-containing protein n=1 Tax=uncultured Secundilactobacillus sp. TaxID=2813935 RepID=UPI00258E17C0|nr:transglycosylase [uncultured Secundilactobacillus sp.]
MLTFKSRIATGLMFLGVLFGLSSGLTFTPNDQTVVAQAATTKKLSINQQIAQVNAGLSKKEQAAKNWIAYRESRGYYFVSNGQCYGRYQLLRAYLHGDYSRVNQERTANKYVNGRYGSWTNAKRFWQAHHWY